MNGREVTWRELAAIVDEHRPTVGHSLQTGRSFVHVDGELIWADTAGVVLGPDVPGAGPILYARISAWGATIEDPTYDVGPDDSPPDDVIERYHESRGHPVAYGRPGDMH